MNDPANSTSKSVFGHVIAHLTDKLDLEAGARYSFDKKDYTFLRQLVRPFNALPTGTFLFPITTGVTSSERFDPKVALSYRWTGDIMTYAQVATGYKAGGFNPRAGSVAQVVSFDPEDVITYELGAKTEWFDRRARLNAAVFRSDYKNLQMQATAYDNNGVPAILYSNVGKARIQGIELEGNLEPIDGLQFSGQIGYLDYKTIDIGTATNIVLGARAPNVPKWSWALGAQYEIDLGSGGSLTPRIDYIYRGETTGDFLATPTLIEPHYGLLNLHLTWQSDDGDWSVSGEMLNATDKYYYTGKHTGAGNLAGSPGQPRTMLVTVKRQF
jgi:iron complex outermembrane receptor protein